MITISDPGQTLSVAQVATLTAKAAAYPFDLHVEIQTQYALSRAAFEHQVAGFVTPGSRMVSIGVDPIHHFSFVRSSGSLGVPPGPQVAQAGNPLFKAGNLVDGIDAIAAKANELKIEPRLITATGPAGGDLRIVQSQTGVPIVIHEHHTAAGVWWALGGVVALAAAVVWWFSARARRREQKAAQAQVELDAEASELRSRNIEEAGWHDELAAKIGPRPASLPPASVPGYRATYQPSSYLPATRPISVQPAPIIVQQSSNSSGLDMLIGYELGRDSNRPAPIIEPVIVERESTSSSFWSSTPDPAPDTSSSSSWDSSGDSSSSSSFDSGSSDSGGGDSSSGGDW